MKKSKHIELYRKSEKYSQLEWYRIKNRDGLEDALLIKDDKGCNVDIIIQDLENPEYYDTLTWNRGFWYIMSYKRNKQRWIKFDISLIDFDNRFVGFLLWTGPWIGSKEEISELNNSINEKLML